MPRMEPAELAMQEGKGKVGKVGSELSGKNFLCGSSPLGLLDAAWRELFKREKKKWLQKKKKKADIGKCRI